MDAVIQHRLESGKLIRICMRCNQYVDAAGCPDPKMYSLKRLIEFSETPVEARCKHKRVAPLTEFERGRQFGMRTVQAEVNLFRGVVKEISELAGKYI